MTEDVIRYVMIRHDSRELLSNDASLQRYNQRSGKYVAVKILQSSPIKGKKRTDELNIYLHAASDDPNHSGYQHICNVPA